MKRWLANHVWLIFWVVCLSQAALWIWWINFAMDNRPQMIEPKKPAAAAPAESTQGDQASRPPPAPAESPQGGRASRPPPETDSTREGAPP